MRQALALPPRSFPPASPNPFVRALVVKNGNVIGRGVTSEYGGPHAEVNALANARAKGNWSKVKGATVYCTLEPCSHWGKQPPCTLALIEAGVARVVFAARDPNPLLDKAGRGQLERAGIAVTGGVRENEARVQNEGFLSRIEKGRPFVILKLGVSADGKIAGQKGKWITGEQSRAVVHRMRSQVDAMLTGLNTVLADDSRLTVRGKGGKPAARQPLRVVLDAHLRFPTRAAMLSEPGTTVLLTTRAGVARKGRVRLLHAAAARAGGRLEVHVLPASGSAGLLDLNAVMQWLGKRPVNTVMVETGRKLSSALLAAGLVDELALFVAPTFIGPKGLPAFDSRAFEGKHVPLHFVRSRKLGKDVLWVARVHSRG